MIRRVALFVLVAAALSIGGAAAWAHWGAAVNAGAHGAATAASVNAATTPTATLVAAQKVTLTWPAVTLTNGVAVDGYIVKRYNASTMLTDTVLAGCAGTITATTCTESSVPAGSWRYSVYPKIAADWVGTESGLTTPLTVTVPVLTLVKTVFGLPLPTATTGTVTGFGVNEAITYRLDSATALTGFPAVVDTTGYAPISSLTIPATTDGPHTVYVVGANGSIASIPILVDSVAPTVTPSLSPVANGSGWNNTSPVTVTLTGADATSGVALIKYTTDGTDPSSSGTAVTYSTPFSVATTRTVRYYAIDNAGNASTVTPLLVKVDTVAPVNGLALSGVTGARLSGTTVYYRGVATGSFTITNTVTDAGSGPASSSTAALGGTSTGFSHTASTVTTPSGGPYVSNAFSWTAGTTSAPTETVTGADVAGNTAATGLTFSNDSTGPAGGSVDATGLTGTGSRYSTSTGLSVAFAAGTDSGVGLATSGLLLQRATATLTSGSCGSYGSYSTIATDPAGSPYANTVTDQACYRYQYVVLDLLGNSTTYVSGDIKVDTTAPSAPGLAASATTNTYLTGTTLYYRAAASAGTVTLTASSTDAASGVLSYTFPAFGTNWTSTPGSTGVNTYAWSGSPAAPGTKTITATNNATLTATTNLTVTDDSVAPSGAAPTVATQTLAGASVPITVTTGTDGGSGMNSTQLQRRSAPMTAGVCGSYGSYGNVAAIPDTTVVNGNCYQYQVVYTDNVGNTSTYANSNVVKAPQYYTCQAAISAVNPDEYYRLAETTGTAAADSSGHAYTGTYTGTFTLGIAGACGVGVTPNSAAAAYVATPQSYNDPSVYSEAIWFKTASTASTTGRLVGFGSASTGGSGNYDRHVYMSADGKLNFGVVNGTLLIFSNAVILTSPAAYNDAKWHYVVATQSGTGMKLYVDGALVNSNAIANQQNYTGYWRVGWDNNFNWGSQTNSNYFNGSFSNAAFWSSTELNSTQIYDQYVAGAVSSGALLTAPSISAQSASIQSVPAKPKAKPKAKATSPTPTPSVPSSSGSPSASTAVSQSPQNFGSPSDSPSVLPSLSEPVNSPSWDLSPPTTAAEP